MSHLLRGTRFDGVLADVLGTDGRPSPGTTASSGRRSTRRSSDAIGCRRSSTTPAIETLAGEIAGSTSPAKRSPRRSRRPRRPIKADAIYLLDLLASPFAPRNFQIPTGARRPRPSPHPRVPDDASNESQYDYWPKLPILVDWNLGNFSVDSRRRRRVPAVLALGLRLVPDRVPTVRLLLPVAGVARTGDRTHFTYSVAHAARAPLPSLPHGLPRGVPTDARRSSSSPRRTASSSSTTSSARGAVLPARPLRPVPTTGGTDLPALVRPAGRLPVARHRAVDL